MRSEDDIKQAIELLEVMISALNSGIESKGGDKMLEGLLRQKTGEKLALKWALGEKYNQ